MDGAEFPEIIVVADFDGGVLPVEFEVLGDAADDGMMEHVVVLAHAHSRQDAGVGMDMAAVADDDVLVDVGKGIDDDVGTQLGFRMDKSVVVPYPVLFVI